MNETDNHYYKEKALFSAKLMPHRSLQAHGLFWVIILFGTIAFLCGLFFFSLGAWPVVGFLGLDIVILWYALKVNRRSAQAFEEVHLHQHELIVVQTDPNGQTREFRFNPFWVRLTKDVHEDLGVIKMQLQERGRTLAIGQFLPPIEKTSFYDAFSEALANAKK